jgi:hypothetical protein
MTKIPALFHLSVSFNEKLSGNPKGTVSLWDTEASAKDLPGEHYVRMDLTMAQIAQLLEATREK